MESAPSDAPGRGMPGLAAERASERELSGGVRFPSLDGYRAVAALMVLVTHVAYSTGAVVQSGLGHIMGRFDFGVPLFFLMSGFLLFRPWVRHSLESVDRPALRRYALRRAARILPLYWVVVVFTLLLLPEIQPVAVSDWSVHLAGLQIYWPGGAVEGLTQTWSLCTEISFYIALPFIGMAAARGPADVDSRCRRLVVVLAVLALSSQIYNVVNVFTDALPLNAGYWLPAYLDWFAAGMLIAVVDVRRSLGTPPAWVRRLAELGQDEATCLVLAAAAFVVAVTPVGGSYDFTATAPWESMFKHWLYLVAAFFFLLPGIVGGQGPLARGLASPIPRRLGLFSYGIFLWHLVLLRMTMDALDLGYFGGGTLLLLFIVLPVTLIASWGTYVLVERPAQRWAHRR